MDLLKTGQETQATQENQSNSQNGIPVPAQVAEETKSLGAQAYIDDVFQSLRNRWGFSLSAYQAYTSALYQTSEPGQSSGVTGFYARSFFNFGKRKSQFHVDLGAGYQDYNAGKGLNSWIYNGSVTFSRPLSKRVSFQLLDEFRSSYNDGSSFFSPYSSINYFSYYYPIFSNEVLLSRQRINQNYLAANLGFQLSRKMQFGMYGGYHYYGLSENGLGNDYNYEAGVSLGYQLWKWLSLDSHYSFYFRQRNNESGNGNTVNIHPGGLHFRLSHSWTMWAGGGAQVAESRGRADLRESVNAGIGYAARDTTLNIIYERGFTSAIGLSELLYSDVVSIVFGRRLTPWMRGSLQSYYSRNTELDSNGALATLSSGGGLEFALTRNLAASVNAFYQNQVTHDFSIQGLGINRIGGSVGLQYFWPSRREQ